VNAHPVFLFVASPRRNTYIGVILTAALGVLSGCRRDDSSSAEAAPLPSAFPVAAPTVKSVRIQREYVADIRAARRAELRSRFRGVIESVSVDEGQRVTEGATLFTVNARARKQDVEVARAAAVGASAELKAAQLDVQNTQLLADKNVVSAAELARAKSKVDLMQARLEQARAAQARASVELDRARIVAPFAGVVDRIPYKAGSAVGEDDLLTTITDTTEVLAYFSLTEREYLMYLRAAAGAPPRTVALELADGSHFPTEGVIDAVGSEIDSATGTITYRARFANPEGILKHGSSGTIVIERELERAIVIPQKSTFEIQNDTYVFVVDQDNTVRARKLQIKARLDEEFVVESGLTPTERIVLEGAQKLKEGMRIAVKG
jgi:membrane fusion protein (multidrug efflux system)